MRHEIAAGYLWSPKRNTNKARNPFYESMREVAPGDIIFSFCDTRIAALGIARSYCYESPKPTEFGTAGIYWEAIGWKIDVIFRELDNRIHPKSHIGELRGLLPEKYSPLRANGDGLQSVYLAEVGRPFAAALFRLIGGEANMVADVAKEVDRAEQLSPSREPDLAIGAPGRGPPIPPQECVADVTSSPLATDLDFELSCRRIRGATW